KEHESGGFRLSTGDRTVSVCPPSRDTTDHVPFGQSLSADFGSFELDGIYQRFTAKLTLRSSLAPSSDSASDVMYRPRGQIHTRRVASLSVRLARMGYPFRTVPRLPVAEHRVALTAL